MLFPVYYGLCGYEEGGWPGAIGGFIGGLLFFIYITNMDQIHSAIFNILGKMLYYLGYALWYLFIIAVTTAAAGVGYGLYLGASYVYGLAAGLLQ